MRSSLVFLAFLLSATIACADAAYPCCSGPVCRGLPTPSSTIGGNTYCCAATQDYPNFNTNTQTCSCSVNYACPSLLGVAVWNTKGCTGPASTFSPVAQLFCTTVSSLSFTVTCNFQTVDGVRQWRMIQRGSCQSGATYLSETIGVVGDTACYNINGGSVVVDCSSTAHSQIDTSIMLPGLHATTQYVPLASYSPVASLNYSVASWDSTDCTSGSARVFTDATGRCKYPADGRSHIFTVKCDTNKALSPWEITIWAASNNEYQNSQLCEQNAPPTATIHGVGASCVATNYGGFSVDCTGQSQGNYVNYVSPVVNGGWSEWSSCSVAQNCLQFRTCTNPPPSSGGASCVGHSEQSCGGCSSTGAYIASSSSTGSQDGGSSTSSSSTFTGSETGREDDSTSTSGYNSSAILLSPFTSNIAPLVLLVLYGYRHQMMD